MEISTICHQSCDFHSGLISEEENTCSEEGCENIVMALINRNPSFPIFGTKTNLFVSSFVFRFRLMNESFVHLPLIQRVVGKFNSSIFTASKSWEVCTQTSIVVELAAQAYFIAAVALGSIQTNLFQADSARLWYKKMNNFLKRCYQAEEAEVITAHVLIAHFCQLTSLTHEFKKHSGFARVLLGCSEYEIPEYLRQGHRFVVLSTQLNSSILPAIQSEVVKCLQFRHFCSAEEFIQRFPFINALAQSQYPDDLLQKADREVIDSAKDCFQVGGTVPICMLCTTMNSVFEKAVTDINFSTNSTLRFLEELKHMFDLEINSSNFALKLFPPIVVVRLNQIRIFKFIFESDFVAARQLLSFTLDTIDGYLLLNLILYSMEHTIHILTVALVFLGMEIEYESLRLKMLKAYETTKQNKSWPKHMFTSSPPAFELICHCDNSECMMLWMKLQALTFFMFDSPLHNPIFSLLTSNK